ncbi:helix-turn-helix domain-containing protein [Nocardia otitidiscaviarum]|uniref:helix-turn-helix domain-containing protein n=1 Tax=Nocardia otitidiscaviarum TaxID=1823 RepID=UPI0018932966|nr:helix-turn-helix domain-containing protein [Nocardia otitidiscaviarum]MBF6241674.1 helix-turn-helix domain-containing protein [Nocardia otitidiscaviarum]
MVVLLDTDGVEPDQRVERARETVRAIAGPQHVLPEQVDGPMSAYLEAWELGGIGLYRARSSALRLVRTERHVRREPSPALGFVVGQTAVERRCGATTAVIPEGGLCLVDLNAPYELAWRERGLTALLLPLDALALPFEVIRTAMHRAPASPLYPLVCGHTMMLTASAEALAADVAARETASATVELARALLTSAAGVTAGDGGAVPAALLLGRIREYVRAHLADPLLGAESIARAHSISVRYLYKLCAGADLSLEQWIIAERLERVRADLARPEYEHRSIGLVASAWGFRDASHFARRFRAAYGMTPREWRRSAARSCSPPDGR